MNDKSKPALSLVTPQARHHFTRFDQIDRLIGAGESDSEIGYMGRLMALCSLPRTNPGHRKEFKRVNGPYQLYMVAGRTTSSRSVTYRVYCSPGFAPKRYGPKAVVWSLEKHFPTLCGS